MFSSLEPSVDHHRAPKRHRIVGVALAALLLMAVAAPAASARAISHNGSSGTGFEYSWNTCTGFVCIKWTGVYGQATTIAVNKQVKVYGDRTGTDPQTQWFTTKNKNYYSPDGYLGGNTPKMDSR